MDAKQMVNGITGSIGACLLFFGGMWLLANHPNRSLPIQNDSDCVHWWRLRLFYVQALH